MYIYIYICIYIYRKLIYIKKFDRIERKLFTCKEKNNSNVAKTSKGLLEVTQSNKEKFLRLNGNSVPCSSTRPSLCCTQVLDTQRFMSQQTKRTFNIFHKLTSKSHYVIYLMECILFAYLFSNTLENPRAPLI